MKRRKLSILMSFIFVFVVQNMNAQAQSGYKPFNQFNSDTVAYLKYNFRENRGIIIRNAPMSSFFNKLEIPIRSFEMRIQGNRIIGIIFFTRSRDNITPMPNASRAYYAILVPFDWDHMPKVAPFQTAIPGLEDGKIMGWNPSYRPLFDNLIIDYAFYQRLLAFHKAVECRMYRQQQFFDFLIDFDCFSAFTVQSTFTGIPQIGGAG